MTTKYDDLSSEQLDSEVAERVMGWKHYKSEQGGNGAYWKDKERVFQAYDWQCCPSTSMDACLEHVIPAMNENKHWMDMSQLSGNNWSVCFQDNTHGNYWHKSLPRATCIAALLALDAMEVESG